MLFGCLMLLNGFLLSAGPLFRLLHLDGDTFSRYQHGGWYSGCDPVMSPDGKTIVYSSPRSGRGDLYAVNTDGTGTHRLTSDPLYEAEPCFSPDGKLIAYVKQMPYVRYSYVSEVFVMNVDGSGQHQVTSGKGGDEYFHPVFMPDGKRVACSCSTQHQRGLETAIVSITDGTISQRRMVSGWEAVPMGKEASMLYTDACPADMNNTGRQPPPSDHCVWKWTGAGAAKALIPGWSPSSSQDRKLIAFLGEPYSQTLWLMNADGSQKRLLFTHDGHYLEHPTFTPDSKHILFHEVLDLGVGNIVLVRRNGTNPQVITSTK